ncbi:MAG: peptidoglycan-binding domain-containing protein [Ramlibacter sp.]
MFDLRQRAAATALSVCTAFAISGCSLLNPYVRATELDAPYGSPRPSTAPGQSRALDEATRAAAAQRKAYYEAVGDRAKLRNGLPLVLIPLSAAALYKGATGGGGESTRKLLLKEGLLGASLFGIGSYYTSSSREQIYLAGAKALSCSIYATTPYDLPAHLVESLSTARIRQLSSDLAVVRQTTVEVQQFHDTIPANDVNARRLVQALVTRAEVSIAAAARTLKQTIDIQAALDDAGARLRATVETIAAEVNLQISRAEPDPATILTIASGLTTSAKQFAPGGSFGSSTPEKAQSFPRAVASAPLTAVDLLPSRVNAVDQQVAELQFALDVMAQRVKAVPALDTCVVETMQARLDVSPSEATMKVGETRQFVVRSSIGIPSIEWIGAIAPEQVTLTKTPMGETMLVQVKYVTAVPGLSQIVFQAAAKEVKREVTILLQPSMSVGAPPEEKEKEKEKEKKTTNAGSDQKKTTQDSDPKGVGQGGVVAHMVPPRNGKNAFEQGLPLDKMREMQRRLGVEPSGTFDPPTRAAITKWQQANKQFSPVANGVLNTSETFAQIMR